MKNYFKRLPSIILIAGMWLFLMMWLFSCSSSSSIYERGADGKIHKVRQPQCVENW